MSEIRINECGAYEREVEQNWAAAYAKRLAEELEIKHDEDKRVIDTSLEALSAGLDLRATKTELDDAVDIIEGELEHYASLSDLAEEAEARSARDNALADGTGLENNCIYSRHIREGNVTTGKIHDGDVTAAKLANGAVTGVKLAEGAVTEGKIATGAVTASKINDGAVSSLGLADAAVTGDKLAIGAVTEGKIASGAVTEGKLASGAVTEGKLGSASVKRAKLHSDAKISETINSSGDLQFRYGDNEHISFGALSDKVVSVFSVPIRDAAAQKWITNNCIIDTVDPPDTFDGGFEAHLGLLYLQSDSLTVMKVFALAGVTALGVNVWRQIYPAFSEYSTTPQRVGTWIDNKPVWRVVLPYIAMADGVRHLRTNQANDRVFVNICELLSDYISDSGAIDDAVIVDNKIYGCSEFRSQQIIPRVRGTAIHFSESSYDYDDLITYGNGSWGGYFEFTCPEEYIISGAEAGGEV